MLPFMLLFGNSNHNGPDNNERQTNHCEGGFLLGLDLVED